LYAYPFDFPSADGSTRENVDTLVGVSQVLRVTLRWMRCYLTVVAGVRRVQVDGRAADALVFSRVKRIELLSARVLIILTRPWKRRHVAVSWGWAFALLYTRFAALVLVFGTSIGFYF